ncbi:MAG: sigma-54-dependent response regulator transcription factor AlgB [Synoicihabitans sp.]
MTILIVDDQPNILRTTAYALQSMGHEPLTAENSRQAARQIESEKVDAMLLDVNLGNENGLDFLKKLRDEGNLLPTIVFTAQTSVESAVEAMRRGAFDYIPKPFIPEDLEQKLIKLNERRQMQTKVTELETQVAKAHPTVMLESNEPAVQKAYNVAFKAASSQASVLILGPSGTGKTVLAKAVHDRSSRADKPFITINCPSLSRELLESELFGHVKGAFTGALKDTWGKVAAADGGTLFLDEIGELPLEIQPKLLRLLQDREYERVGDTRTRKADIRLIAATNRDLAQEVETGAFREDLFYRLKVIAVEMPSLADRPTDLLPLAENYLTHFAREQGRGGLHFSSEVRTTLANYEWPGNLRELRNVIERTVILAAENEITPEDLPEEFHAEVETSIRPGHLVTIHELESEHIRRVIAKSESLDGAAQVLGIDSATLYRKRKRMGLA